MTTEQHEKYEREEAQLLIEVKKLGQVSFEIPRCVECGELTYTTAGITEWPICQPCSDAMERELS